MSSYRYALDNLDRRLPPARRTFRQMSDDELDAELARLKGESGGLSQAAIDAMAGISSEEIEQELARLDADRGPDPYGTDALGRLTDAELDHELTLLGVLEHRLIGIQTKDDARETSQGG